MYLEKGKSNLLTKKLVSILEYKKTKFITKEELISLIKDHVPSKNPLRLIKNLINAKILISIKKNNYVYVPVSSIDKKPTVSEFEINEVYLGQNNKYYIGLTNALNFHGFTTQVPNKLFVFNTKYNIEKNIINYKIKYIKVSEDKLYGAIFNKYPYSDKEKTIIDILNYFKHVDSLDNILYMIKQNKDLLDENKLIRYAKKQKSIKLLKLIGIITENNDLYEFLRNTKKLNYYTKIRNTKNKKKYKTWKIILI